MEARTEELLDDGFPILATGAYPHWTIVFSEPTPVHCSRVRRRFADLTQNPVWVERRWE